jgi:hypothetical protein
MIQFYLLSVILNLLCGYALSAKRDESPSAIVRGARLLIADKGLRMAMAVLSIAVGVLKLIFALRGDIPVIGDFLPATAGIVVGSALFLDVSDEERLPFMKQGSPAARMEKFLVSYKVPIGYAGMLAGLIHFLFPMVLFL